jgi:ABC-type methionine transport system permease subunit
MKRLLATVAGTLPIWVIDAASAQSGPMMNGGMGDSGWMGGYGGYWMPVLVVIVVGLVAWIVMQKRK